MQEFAKHRGAHRLFEVGIVQHHEGAVAAQFQSDVLEVLAAAGDTANASPHRGRTGKGNQRRQLMFDKGITDLATCTDHHTEHTRGQPGFFKNLRQ
ncbi:hypothetical protein D3C77_352750 [compost metagenome]